MRWLLTVTLLLGSMALRSAAQTNETNTAGQSPSATAAPASTSNPAPNPAKKVWTNDNLPSANKRVSAAGAKGDQKYPLTKAADSATVEKIRKNLQKLEEQVEDIKKQLAIYKEFQKGEPVSSDAYVVDKGINRIPVDQQMLALEKKKKDLEAQIDELYEDARKKGIDPGLLR